MALFERKKKATVPFCSAVVAAAGSSTRMEGQDKMFSLLGEIPVLARTLTVLEACLSIHEIVVVTRSDLIVPVSQLCRDFSVSKVTKVVEGGADRTRSVLNGTAVCDRRAALIAVHDGARPLVSQAVLSEVLDAGARTGAAAPAVPVKDTIKQAQGGIVTGTPERSTLFAVQTPQVFEASLLKAALRKAAEEGAPLTDDCSAVERLGMKVTLTRGEYENIKITTPVDLLMGEAILNGRT